MKLKELEERVKALEARVGIGMETRIAPSPHDTFKRHNTINPAEMEVGRVAYVGNFQSLDGKTGSRFGADNNSIGEILMSTDVSQMANVMTAFANVDRLNILKTLLNEQMSATQLMERFNFSTTGKLYNHLSKLEDLNLIVKEGSIYRVVGPAIGCVILVFNAFNKIMRNMK